MAKKKLPEILITELFLVKADWSRTYIGEIRREVNGRGKNIIIGKVAVEDGFIWSMSSEGLEEVLRKNMDEICIMKLDYGLHSDTGVSARIFGNDFFLN